MPNWLRGVGLFLVLVLALSIGKVIGIGGGKVISSAVLTNEKSFNPAKDTRAILLALKAEMDKRVPSRVDGITILDGFKVDDRRVQYQYRIEAQSRK